MAIRPRNVLGSSLQSPGCFSAGAFLCVHGYFIERIRVCETQDRVSSQSFGGRLGSLSLPKGASRDPLRRYQKTYLFKKPGRLATRVSLEDLFDGEVGEYCHCENLYRRVAICLRSETCTTTCHSECPAGARGISILRVRDSSARTAGLGMTSTFRRYDDGQM